MKPLKVRVGKIKEVRIDLTELPPGSYEIITKTYWCQGEDFPSLEDFMKSEYYAKGYRCKAKKDIIWFEDCKWGFQFNDEVNIRNAKRCGFGVLVYKPTGEEIMFDNDCMDVITSIVAYQSLTYHCINEHYVPLIYDEYFKITVGKDLYEEIIRCLTCELH